MNLEKHYKKLREEYLMSILYFKKTPIDKIAQYYNKPVDYIEKIIKRDKKYFTYTDDDKILRHKDDSYYTEAELFTMSELCKYDDLSIEEKIIYIESESEEGPINIKQLFKYDG